MQQDINRAACWQLTALQLTSGPNAADNMAQIAALLANLPPARPQLVCLPEGALCFDGEVGANLALAEPLGQGPLQQQLAQLAKQHQIYLHVGTFPTLPPLPPLPKLPAGPLTESPQRFAASSLLFSPQGELIADYQKIHLFDAKVNDNTQSYCESSTTQPGQQVRTCMLVDTAPPLSIGFAICYDVRFSGLFAKLRAQGANLLCVPAAFTTVTGAAHWQVLLQARAIETQSFVVASAQTGRHANGRETYGHSLIIDPWGTILADAGTAPGLISVRVDLTEVTALRQKMPVAAHNRFGSDWL